MGLRERKKAQTRQRIADTAHRLFGERGFHGVTVAEVAREAEVAEATLFNYFPSKEDLFYSGLEVFGARLLESVRDRPAGASALAAVRAFLLGDGGQLDRIAAGDRDVLHQARTTARVIRESPALQTRERHVLLGIAAELATAVAPGDAPDPVARAVANAMANALVGVHIALLDLARDRLLGDGPPETIAAEVRDCGARAFALLEGGLRDYAPRTG